MTALIRSPRSLLLRSTLSALAAATILLTAVGLPVPASAAPHVRSIADPQEHDDGPGDAVGTADVSGASGAVAPAVGASRVIGKLVLQNRSNGSSAYVGLSAPESGRNVQRLYSSSAGGAASLAGTYSLPAVGAAGPITGTGTSSTLCLTPAGDGYRALVAARTCTGSPSQDFEWRYVSNKWVSGYALYPVSSPYSLGGTDTDTFVELTMDALTDVVVESQLAPIEPFELRTPAIGATVDTPTPTFSGIGQPGALVSLLTDGQVSLASTRVPEGSSSWSAMSTSLAPGRYTGSAVQSGVGPEVRVPFDFTVGRPLAPGATIQAPTLSPGGSVTVEATFNADAGGQRIDVYHPSGTRITAVEDPAFVVDSLGVGGTLPVGTTSLRFTLRANDDAPIGTATGGRVTYGPSRIKLADFTATIVAGVPVPDAPLVLESPAIGASIPPGAPVFTGTGAPGATIEIVTAWKDEVGDTVVRRDGTWSITWDKKLVPGRYSGGSVIQTVGETAPTKVPYDFTVEVDSIAPLTVTSPTIGQVVTVSIPTFTGTAQPGARVVIVGLSGDELGRVDEVAAGGSWTITWDKSLLPNRYVGGTVKQFVDGVERGSFTYDFTIVLPKLEVSSPKVGDTLRGTRPTFTGKANPGADIEIVGISGATLGQDRADANGKWSITWPKDYLPNRYVGGTVTETMNGTLLRTFVYDFTLVR